MSTYEETIFRFIIFVIALATWSFIYKLILKFILQWSYPNEIARVISSAVVSIIQGIVTSIVGIIIINNCHHDIMWSTHSLSTRYSLIGAAYFLYDTYTIYKNHTLSRPDSSKTLWNGVQSILKHRPLMIFHHVLMVIVFFPIVMFRDGVGDFFVGCFYCLEFSTLFTNLRIILSKIGWRHTRTYVINGLAMLLSFFMCRVLVFPLMYLAYGRQHHLSVYEVMNKIPLHCNLGCLIILLPQLYWFSLMSFGAIKLFSTKSPSKTKYELDDLKTD